MDGEVGQAGIHRFYRFCILQNCFIFLELSGAFEWKSALSLPRRAFEK